MTFSDLVVLLFSFFVVDVCLHVGSLYFCLHLLHSVLKSSYLVLEDAYLFKMFALFFVQLFDNSELLLVGVLGHLEAGYLCL